MLELFYMDVDCLQKSYDRYKNKDGKKAKALMDMIKRNNAFNLLVDKILSEKDDQG